MGLCGCMERVSLKSYIVSSRTHLMELAPVSLSLDNCPRGRPPGRGEGSLVLSIRGVELKGAMWSCDDTSTQTDFSLLHSSMTAVCRGICHLGVICFLCKWNQSSLMVKGEKALQELRLISTTFPFMVPFVIFTCLP